MDSTIEGKDKEICQLIGEVEMLKKKVFYLQQKDQNDVTQKRESITETIQTIQRDTEIITNVPPQQEITTMQKTIENLQATVKSLTEKNLKLKDTNKLQKNQLQHTNTRKSHSPSNVNISPQGKLQLVPNVPGDKDGEIIELRLKLSQANETIASLKRVHYEKTEKGMKREFEKELDKLKDRLAFKENELREMKGEQQLEPSPPKKKQKQTKDK